MILKSLAMYASLFSYMLLTSSYSPWVTENSWNCLEGSLSYLLDYLAVSTDVDIKNLFGKVIYRLETHIPPKYLRYDFLIIQKSISNWHGRDLRGKVIILTESLNNIEKIWTKFKIAHLLVLLQTNGTCEILTWYPYQPGTCHEPPELIRIATCVDGKFPTLNFTFDEEFENTTGCPLVAALADCPLLVSQGKGSLKIGPEVDILNDIAQQQGMVLVQKPQDHVEYFTHHFRNSSKRNAHDLLRHREVDIAGSCLSVALSKTNFEFLPSHLIEHMTWVFPGPFHLPVTFGAITTFHYKIWAMLGITLVLFLTYASMVRSFGYAFSWTFARMFSMSTPPLGNSTHLRIISVLFELAILVITVSYKSHLLANLFIDKEFVYDNVHEASQHGLIALIRPDPLIDFDEFSKDIQSTLVLPEKYKYVDYYDYELLVVNRSVMILGWQLIQEAIIRTTFPKMTYSEIVTTQEEAHAVVYISFFMPPHHPLHDVLSDAALNIVEVGLPSMYIRRALAKLPGDGEFSSKKQNKALQINQIVFIFIIYLVLMTVGLIIFCFEVIVNRFFKSKHETSW